MIHFDLIPFDFPQRASLFTISRKIDLKLLKDTQVEANHAMPACHMPCESSLNLLLENNANNYNHKISLLKRGQ